MCGDTATLLLETVQTFGVSKIFFSNKITLSLSRGCIKLIKMAKKTFKKNLSNTFLTNVFTKY